MKIGDLVKIEPTFFWYDNVPTKWHDSIFIIINMRPDDSKVMIDPYTICDVLTPEGIVYSFYDYEIADCFLSIQNRFEL